jgi:hypothetical protein
MPSVCRVREWYVLSYKEIVEFPSIVDGDFEAERRFNTLLQGIYARHNSVIATVAKGIFEFRQALCVEHGQVRLNMEVVHTTCGGYQLKSRPVQSLPPEVEEGVHDYLDRLSPRLTRLSRCP